MVAKNTHQSDIYICVGSRVIKRTDNGRPPAFYFWRRSRGAASDAWPEGGRRIGVRAHLSAEQNNTMATAVPAWVTASVPAARDEEEAEEEEES